jgi:hypothetical protein
MDLEKEEGKPSNPSGTTKETQLTQYGDTELDELIAKCKAIFVTEYSKATWEMYRKVGKLLIEFGYKRRWNSSLRQAFMEATGCHRTKFGLMVQVGKMTDEEYADISAHFSIFDFSHGSIQLDYHGLPMTEQQIRERRYNRALIKANRQESELKKVNHKFFVKQVHKITNQIIGSRINEYTDEEQKALRSLKMFLDGLLSPAESE